VMALPLREARETFEKNYMTVQLRRFDGNVSRMAGFVGMERSALHRKLRSLDVVLDTALSTAGRDEDG
jgi:two-component system nitrogen regulation response regulator NtrX